MEAENRLRKQGSSLLDKPESNDEVPFGFSETKLDKKEDA